MPTQVQVLATNGRGPKCAVVHASMYMYTRAQGIALYSFQRALSPTTSSNPLNNGDPAQFLDK